ncbi:MAG: hypothetical protein AB7U73_01155 [Pirellulales bacterium]
MPADPNQTPDYAKQTPDPAIRHMGMNAITTALYCRTQQLLNETHQREEARPDAQNNELTRQIYHEHIARSFRYHAPKGDQAPRYEELRTYFGGLASLLVAACPPSRELSEALTCLETANMFANAAIARNE